MNYENIYQLFMIIKVESHSYFFVPLVLLMIPKDIIIGR